MLVKNLLLLFLLNGHAIKLPSRYLYFCHPWTTLNLAREVSLCSSQHLMKRCIAHQTAENKSRTSILTQPTKLPIKQQRSRNTVQQEAERMYKPKLRRMGSEMLSCRHSVAIALTNSQHLWLSVQSLQSISKPEPNFQHS